MSSLTKLSNLMFLGKKAAHFVSMLTFSGNKDMMSVSSWLRRSHQNVVNFGTGLMSFHSDVRWALRGQRLFLPQKSWRGLSFVESV